MASRKQSARKRDRRAGRGPSNGSAVRSHAGSGRKAKARTRAKGAGKASKVRSGGGNPAKVRVPAASVHEAPEAAAIVVPVENREPPALPVPIASFTF